MSASDLPILPVTKFRVPRLREGTVVRVELLDRLLESVASQPVTLVCAPGGSGKTTLLAQMSNRLREQAVAIVWVALDEEDDDANRVFATLLQALEPLQLAWDTPPRDLAARVIDAGTQTRAALAVAVNALCTSSAARVVIVFDDFHRIGRPDVVGLIESLVERLPEHVTVVIGTRAEPALPLARWRAHGEVGEFSLSDLRFNAAEALELAGADGLVEDAAREAVSEALQRTQGWAVGLSMLLQAGGAAAGMPRARTSTPPASNELGQRRLFAYLAHEVLARVPEDIQDFVLRCSILAELTPRLCDAVTGGDGAARMLGELYRRDLFLTVVDEDGPVLRFHDLFREFLERELSRRLPEQEVRSLHERAARAEETSARAIHHYLSGELWDEALWLILRVGESLVAAGAIATLERWIDQVPEHVRRGNARVAYLRGSCAWLRWDWSRACRELAPAVAGLTASLETPSRVRACFQLVDALCSSGQLAEAWRRLDEAKSLELDEVGQAEFTLLRAWCHAADGRMDAVASNMREFVTLAERHPEVVCPQTAGRIHCLLIGVPGMVEVFDRYARASRRVRQQLQEAPWQLAGLTIEGWARLWQGDLAGAQAAVEHAEVLYARFGSIRLMGEQLGQLRARHAAARGRHDEALAIARRHLDGLQAPELVRHRAVWLRAYRLDYARMLWMAGRDAEFLALVPALTAPRAPEEWGFVDVAIDVTRGQAALLRGQPREAIDSLVRACDGYRRVGLPAIVCDPRVALAYAWTALRDRRRAWETFEPLYRAAVEQGQFGPLLLDSRRHVLAVLDALPTEVRDHRDTVLLRETLELWGERAAESADAAGQGGPLARLTDREREVLAAVAAGAGNKHIARALDLSLHTVKRHIANILDKLDCASRGQAAELHRRATAADTATVD
ncbi:MAG TPA: LuxR C-terminal-related transcriptional regulator [Steroidobacteraceae bacterium]|nr:LuxR C-terminal-related transcriptional regulator [Steroidobacteraceae bacterium]